MLYEWNKGQDFLLNLNEFLQIRVLQNTMCICDRNQPVPPHPLEVWPFKPKLVFAIKILAVPLLMPSYYVKQNGCPNKQIVDFLEVDKARG